jgi:hypothetical protein
MFNIFNIAGQILAKHEDKLPEPVDLDGFVYNGQENGTYYWCHPEQPLPVIWADICYDGELFVVVDYGEESGIAPNYYGQLTL